MNNCTQCGYRLGSLFWCLFDTSNYWRTLPALDLSIVNQSTAVFLWMWSTISWDSTAALISTTLGWSCVLELWPSDWGIFGAKIINGLRAWIDASVVCVFFSDVYLHFWFLYSVELWIVSNICWWIYFSFWKMGSQVIFYFWYLSLIQKPKNNFTRIC